MPLVSRYLDPSLVERLNHLELSARSVVEGSTIGLHKSPVKGASVEFRQHRFYTPGDEPRRLDWRVLARTDRPYIKEYDEETNVRCVILIDASGSMGYTHEHGSKFDAAARIAASLAYLMLRQTESVGLATFSDKLTHYLAPHSGTMQLSRVIDQLERTIPRGPSNFPSAVQELADRLGRRALVIVLSDFFTPTPGLREGFARLKYERHETICLQVIDPDEEEFPFRNWSRFRGLEGEIPMLTEPAMVRKAYLDNFRNHQAQLLESCRSMRLEHHLYRTDKPLADWLTQMLSRRK
jgi:uncharacterized protein (DUF58 family)